MNRTRARQILDYFLKFGPQYTGKVYGWELVREAVALIVLENNELHLRLTLPSEAYLLDATTPATKCTESRVKE